MLEGKMYGELPFNMVAVTMEKRCMQNLGFVLVTIAD